MPWWRHQMETFSALLVLCVGIHRSLEIDLAWWIGCTFVAYFSASYFASARWWCLVKHVIQRYATWLRSGGRHCCYVTMIMRDCPSIVTSIGLNTYCDVTQCMSVLWLCISQMYFPKVDSLQWSAPPQNNGACVIIWFISLVDIEAHITLLLYVAADGTIWYWWISLS